MKTNLGEAWIQYEGIAQKSYVCYPGLKRHPHGYQAGLHTLLGAGGALTKPNQKKQSVVCLVKKNSHYMEN